MKEDNVIYRLTVEKNRTQPVRKYHIKFRVGTTYEEVRQRIYVLLEHFDTIHVEYCRINWTTRETWRSKI